MNSEPITKFKGEYAFLSNFYEPVEIEYDGLKYNSTEACYQAHKTQDLELREAISQMTAKQSKAAGKKLKMRPDWDEIKLDLMNVLVRIKFAKPELAEKLLATGDAELVESNWWHDRYWGVCNGGRRCKCKGVGENHLGKILMQVRQELREI